MFNGVEGVIDTINGQTLIRANVCFHQMDIHTVPLAEVRTGEHLDATLGSSSHFSELILCFDCMEFAVNHALHNVEVTGFQTSNIILC